MSSRKHDNGEANPLSTDETSNLIELTDPIISPSPKRAHNVHFLGVTSDFKKSCTTVNNRKSLMTTPMNDPLLAYDQQVIRKARKGKPRHSRINKNVISVLSNQLESDEDCLSDVGSENGIYHPHETDSEASTETVIDTRIIDDEEFEQYVQYPPNNIEQCYRDPDPFYMKYYSQVVIPQLQSAKGFLISKIIELSNSNLSLRMKFYGKISQLSSSLKMRFISYYTNINIDDIKTLKADVIDNLYGVMETGSLEGLSNAILGGMKSLAIKLKLYGNDPIPIILRSILIMLVGIASSANTSIMSVLAHITACINTICSVLALKYELIIKPIMKAFHFFFDNQPQSKWEDLKDMLFGIKAIQNSEMLTKFRSILLRIVTLPILQHYDLNTYSENLFSQYELNANTKLYKKKGVSVVSLLLDSSLYLHDLLSSGIDYFYNGEISYFVMSNTNLIGWHKKCTKVFKYRNRLKVVSETDKSKITNLFNAKDMPIDEYQHLLEYCLLFGETMSSQLLKAKDPIYNSVNNIVIKLREIDNIFYVASTTGTLQVQPIGFLCFGRPKTGKSQLTMLLKKAYANVYGLSPELVPDITFIRNAEDKFVDGLKRTTKIMQLEDIASIHQRSNKEDKSLNDVLLYCSNVAFTVNKSAVEDKGSTVAHLDMVIATTNSLTMGVDYDYVEPAAFKRRLQHVIFTFVKARYKKNGAQYIDTEKVAIDQALLPKAKPGEPQQYVDPLEYKYCIATPIENNKVEVNYKPVHETEFISASYLYVLLKMAIFKHKNEQNNYVKMNADIAKTPECKHGSIANFCELCFAEGDNVDDELELQSGNKNTIEEEDADLTFIKDTIKDKTSDVKLYFASAPNFYEKLKDRFKLLRFHLGNAPSITTERLTRSFNKIRSNRYSKNIINMTLFLSLFVIILLTILKLTRWLMKKVEVNDSSARSSSNENVEHCMSECIEHDVILQGGEISKVEIPQRKNAYPIFPIQITQVPDGQIYKAMNTKTLVSIFKRHLFGIVSQDEVMNHTIRLFSQVFMVNKHLINDWFSNPETDDTTYKLEIVGVKQGAKGLNANMEFIIGKNQIVVDNGDTCLIYIPDSPPGIDLIKFFPHKLDIIEGLFKYCSLVKKRDDGEFIKGFDSFEGKMDYKISIENLNDGPHNFTIPCITYERETITGDCGSPFILDGLGSTFCAGMHVAYSSARRKAVVSILNQEDLYYLVNKLMSRYQDMPTAQSRNLGISLRPAKQIDRTIHHKSFLHRIEDGTADVFGTVVGMPTFSPKTKVQPSEWSKDILKHYKHDMIWEAPVMKKGFVKGEWHDPLYNCYNRVFKLKNLIPLSKTLKAIDEYYEETVMNINPQVIREIVKPLTLEQAINGIDGIDFIDPIKMNTSSGYPWFGRKSEKFPLNNNNKREPDLEMRTIINIMHERCKNGERTNPIVNTCLKDEVMKISKRGKTRVFSTFPVWFNIIYRIYYLPVFRLMLLHPTLFECAVGCSSVSLDWTQFAENFQRLGKRLEGFEDADYGKFDKDLCGKDNLCIHSFFIKIARFAGYSEVALTAMKTLAIDATFIVVLIGNVLVQLRSSNASGMAGTIMVNTVRNTTLFRICFRTVVFDTSISFKSSVILLTYGDDAIFHCGQMIIIFNASVMSMILEKYGLEMTNGDKTKNFRLNKTLGEIEFLKRRFVYNKEFQRYVAPLREESIVKMLAMIVPSKTITLSQQHVEILSSANLENFAYGKKYFDAQRNFYCQLLAKYKYPSNTAIALKTYKDIKENVYNIGA